MFRKITSLVVALSAMLLLQFADCYAMSLDEQSMQCCHHMPCDPANKAHDCCKAMVSSPVPSALPTVHVHFVAPLAIVVDRVPLAEMEPRQVASSGFSPPQDSPPGLYIVHASLLI